MKRIGRCLALSCLFAVLLSSAAFANSAAPDYRVAVRIVHAPEEPYYMDLLGELEGKSQLSRPEGYDLELLDALQKAAPDGWLPCSMSTSLWEEHYSGDIVGKNGSHVYHGFHIPRVFRIAIVTESGESWVSEPMERQLMNTAVKVDWEKKTAVMPPVQVLYVLQFLSTLVPTLLIEGLIFYAFRFPGKRNWLTFLFVNLATQGALSIVLCLNVVGSGGKYIGVTMLVLLPVELLIALGEALAYMKLLRGQPKRKAFLCGITANAASFLAGLFTVGPFYSAIVTLMERIL